MRVLVDPAFYFEMQGRSDHTPDCFVRPGQYLHHMYVEGVKYVVAPALLECLKQAETDGDAEALQHLRLHTKQYQSLLAQAEANGPRDAIRRLGPPPPTEEEGQAKQSNSFVPPEPQSLADIGLSVTLLQETVLRALYNGGRMTGSEIAVAMKLPYAIVGDLLPPMRKQGLIDMVGQRPGALGDSGLEYELKPPKGPAAVQDALQKTAYCGPAPVPFEQYLKSIAAQTIKSVTVTRCNIQQAFSDLVITPEVFNEIGPAINSAASIFLFGYPGNGKTSIAERMTRLMGDDIYIPYAVEANGQIVKLFDPIVHTQAKSAIAGGSELLNSIMKREGHDDRYVKIKRPTVVVGGELTLTMLDLKYNEAGKFYEAPLQMKANGGMFMIDDFGRQQVRPMDLLNRWIVPLEKKYDYLTTVTGTKIQVPFDQLLVFSTNLDPNQLADEAFLRRIKFKIEVRDPDEAQWRQIWRLVCKSRKVEYDDKGIDYLVEKYYRPTQRPFRMCQPRDILDQMISIAKYDMEPVTFNPDLIDAACATYFVQQQKRDFGAKVRLE